MDGVTYTMGYRLGVVYAGDDIYGWFDIWRGWLMNVTRGALETRGPSPLPIRVSRVPLSQYLSF